MIGWFKSWITMSALEDALKAGCRSWVESFTGKPGEPLLLIGMSGRHVLSMSLRGGEFPEPKMLRALAGKLLEAADRLESGEGGPAEGFEVVPMSPSEEEVLDERG